MNTNERAKAIRKELRAKLGATSRDISVRSDKYSMGATIYVKIKSADYSLEAVKEIAESHASIRRDSFGEILKGGNVYVSVDYAADAIAPLVDELQEKLVSVYRSGETVEIKGLSCRNVEDGHNGFGGLEYWEALDANGEEIVFTYGLASIARQLAEKFCSGYTAPKKTEKTRPALRLVTETAPAAPTTNTQIEFLSHLGIV